MKRLLLLLIASLLLAGCAAEAPREYVVLLPDEDGHVGEVRVASRSGEVVLTQSGQTAVIGAEGTETVTMPVEEIQRRFGKALEAKPEAVVRFTLYFETGGTELTDSSKELLPRLLATVERRMPCEVDIIGHTDTMGDDEANLALGLKRAELVRDMLLNLGLEPNSVQTDSHGENNQLVETPDNTDEPRNRRVEAVIR